MSSKLFQALRSVRPASSALRHVGRASIVRHAYTSASTEPAPAATPAEAQAKGTTTTTAPRARSSYSSYSSNNRTTVRKPVYTSDRVHQGKYYPSDAYKGVNDGVLDPQPAMLPPESTETFVPTPSSTSSSSADPSASRASLTNALKDSPSYAPANGNGNGNGDASVDWSSSFHGLSTGPFSAEVARVLMRPIAADDVEIKPDGIIYLPEIKYRRILNEAFQPGGWGMAPRGELVVGEKVVTREYALIVHGRFVAQARGECQFFSDDTIPTAGEGAKSNALLRCCKDLGIASELWDPRFIRQFKKSHCKEVWAEHLVNKKKKKLWIRNDGEVVYPYKQS